MNRFIILLLFCLLAPEAPAANPLQGSSQEATTLNSKVGIQATLAVSVAREVSRLESRRLLVRAQPVAQSAQQQTKKNWIRRHPKLFGALVGFGVGCPLGAAQVGGSQDDFFNALDEFACPFLGGVGAAVGAGIGAAVSR